MTLGFLQPLLASSQYTAMTKSIIVFDQLVVAWIVKTVAIY
jgi:hypothetical protein